MNFLFKLWIFDFNIASLISFFVGILFGVVLVFLIYILVCVQSMGSKKFLVKKQAEGYKEDEVRELVINAQNEFKDKTLRKNTPKIKYCTTICKDLAYEIAASYFPNSKYPLLELSVDEVTLLLEYIKERVDEILSRRGLRLIRKLRISTIVDVSIKGGKFAKSNTYKVGRDLTKTASAVSKVINLVNPVYWGKKLIMDNSINAILNKLYLVIIAVVGEEVFKVYSKKVFDTEPTIETNIKELLSSIDGEAKDFDEAEKEILDNVFTPEVAFKRNTYQGKYIENDYRSIFNSKMNFMDVGDKK